MSTLAEDLLPVLDRFLDEAHAIAHPKAVATARAPLQRTLERRLARAFDVQGKAVLRRLSTRRSRFPPELREALRLRDLESALEQAVGATKRLFGRAIQEVAALAVLVGAQTTLADTTLASSFTLKNTRAVAFLRDYGAARVTLIDDTTRETLRTILVQAVDEGWSYNRTAKAITDRYAEFRVGRPQEHIRSRAHLIAVTEVGEAYEHGNLLAAHELAASGTPMEKSWLTAGDSRVSALCQGNAAAGWIPVADAFPSGHERPLGHPACRCALLTRATP